MINAHVCNIDCQLITYPTGATAHMMYASEPSSAAGRYQWEQNAAIKLQGRRAWRATGQGQSRECRVWDEWRKNESDAYVRYGILGRRISRELREMELVH